MWEYASDMHKNYALSFGKQLHTCIDLRYSDSQLNAVSKYGIFILCRCKCHNILVEQGSVCMRK